MKRPDPLLLVAIWEFVSAFFAFVGVVVVGVFFFPPVLNMWANAIVGGLVVMAFVMTMLLAAVGLGVAAGVGVLLGKEWGRILSMIHAALSLVWVPVGTAAGVLVLVYLTRPNVAEYFRGPSGSG